MFFEVLSKEGWTSTTTLTHTCVLSGVNNWLTSCFADIFLLFFSSNTKRNARRQRGDERVWPSAKNDRKRDWTCQVWGLGGNLKKNSSKKRRTIYVEAFFSLPLFQATKYPDQRWQDLRQGNCFENYSNSIDALLMLVPVIRKANWWKIQESFIYLPDRYIPSLFSPIPSNSWLQCGKVWLKRPGDFTTCYSDYYRLAMLVQKCIS